MATVFMKWLERSPGAYDRGIQLLTLNRLQRLKEQIAANMIRSSDRVLEIGCGTGSLAVMMARRGAIVTGVDASKLMLDEAEEKVAAAELEDRVTLLEMDASQMADHFETGSFAGFAPGF